jgi:hypothetical protein
MTDATVEGAAPDSADASVDQSVYTNMFDVQIQYADQSLPDVQAAPEGGGGGSEAGLGIPDCPPFIYTDSKGNPLPASDCDPTVGGCNDPNWSFDSIPADWSDGGEIPAQEGGVCGTYPWLGSPAMDQCTSLDLPGGLTDNTGTYNPLPPCNWARDAGIATQGLGTGQPRYDLCVQLYKCMMRTRCFFNASPRGGVLQNAMPCFCLKPSDLVQGSGSFSAATCVSEPGPCYMEEVAAIEAPHPSDQMATADYVRQNIDSTQMANGLAGVEGAMLNQLLEQAGPACFPTCALDHDAGLDCGL